MAEFRIKLADLPIQVSAAYDSTSAFCQNYYTQEPAELHVRVRQEDIDFARQQIEELELLEFGRTRPYPDSYLETVALCEVIADTLLFHNVLLFHGSVVAVGGKCYMFTASSGTGKTTHTQLWLRAIPGSFVLNGDKPFVLFREDGVYACGSPWQGKENFGTNAILPLEGICILERDTENHIQRIPFWEAYQPLLAQSHRSPQMADLVSYLQLLKKLETVPMYRLGCNMDPEAALVSYRGMTGAGPDL